jgi:hypothetical protein
VLQMAMCNMMVPVMRTDRWNGDVGRKGV